MQRDDAAYLAKTIDFAELSKRPYEGAYITIGNFDGVHLGHQALIGSMVDLAYQQKSPAVVVTFFPNPADYFHPELQSFYLTTHNEKCDVLCHLGLDEVITLRFNRDLAEKTPSEFLTQLKTKLGLSVLMVGDDFALGKNRMGTIPVLKSLGGEMGVEIRIFPQVDLDDEEISSTRIRQFLDAGDLPSVERLLERRYEVSGWVGHGSDRGARIGLPTANIDHWRKKKLPAVGVYATRVILAGETHLGITNIGFRPTFETQEQPNVETHILDFTGDIYGERMTLQFIQKIRDEQKFPSLEAFLEQIERDKATARKIFTNDQE
jgi:riboflavin kinase/FMN adenylyltransferase